MLIVSPTLKSKVSKTLAMPINPYYDKTKLNKSKQVGT